METLSLHCVKCSTKVAEDARKEIPILHKEHVMVVSVAPPVRVHRPAIGAILGCLVASAASLALAPVLMPVSYSWVSHTTSESAAQGVDGAWLARLGFLFFGLGVLALGRISSASWGRLAAASHAVFGISMIATAAFSSRSWEPGMPFDQTEDLLHSAAATLMAVAFSVGVFTGQRQDPNPPCPPSPQTGSGERM